MTYTSQDVPGRPAKTSFLAATESKTAAPAEPKSSTSAAPWTAPAADAAPAPTRGLKGPPLC